MFNEDQIDGMDFETFCKETGLSSEQLFLTLQREIDILQRRYHQLRELYRLGHDVEDLLIEVKRRLERKKDKRERYLKYLRNN